MIADADAALCPTQVDQYRRDGYLVLRSVLAPKRVGELQQAADEFAERARAFTADTPEIELDDKLARNGGPRLIRRIKSPHRHHQAFADALTDPAMLDLAQALIGPNIRRHHTKLNAKQPGGSGHVEWHTDWGYYPHTNDDLLEIAVAIDPSTKASGCLKVLPGSHLGPAFDHTEDGKFVGAVAPGSFDPSQTVALELEPGDVSVHHVRLLHGSGPNTTNRQRRLLLLGYAAADAWPLMAQHQPHDWPEWDERMLRGRPSTEARMTACPVRVPLPKAEALGLFSIQRQMRHSHFDQHPQAANPPTRPHSP